MSTHLHHLANKVTDRIAHDTGADEDRVYRDVWAAIRDLHRERRLTTQAIEEEGDAIQATWAERMGAVAPVVTARGWFVYDPATSDVRSATDTELFTTAKAVGGVR